MESYSPLGSGYRPLILKGCGREPWCLAQPQPEVPYASVLSGMLAQTPQWQRLRAGFNLRTTDRVLPSHTVTLVSRSLPCSFAVTLIHCVL